ncbi:MAG: ATP-binding cassette domain-containing protein [Devosiaceae bacterium]|nr:ATP-binding cassette domain-containing protein [Devosiaceae bacterium]
MSDIKSKIDIVKDNDAKKKPAKLKPLRALVPFLIKYPVRLILTLIFLLLAAALSLAIPILLGGIIDEGFVTQNLDKVFQYGLAIIGVATIMAAASGFRFYFISIIGERVLTDLRREVFNRLLSLDASFFDVHRVGELTSRLNGDVATIRGAIGSSASVALRSLVILIGALIMMFLTSPKLAFSVVIIGPLVVIPIVLFVHRLRAMSRTTQDRLADISAMATEILSSIKTVKAFVQEKIQIEIFSKRSEQSFDAEARRLLARSFLVALVIFLATVALLLVIWFGARAVFAGDVSEGQLVQFLVYALMASSSLTNMSDIWGSLQTVAGATERLIEILQTKPKIIDPIKPKKMPVPSLGEVEFRNVEFSYQTRKNDTILQSVSFLVKSGETVALVGPSGSGKSTIFSLLHRFYDIDGGKILVDRLNISDVKASDLRSQFAYVEQESVIFAGTIADNIRFGKPDASDEEIRKAAKAALVDEFVDKLEHGYQSLVGERGLMLSGGQKQRIAIARALLKDAPILLLDEATSALDAQSEHKVQQALEHLMVGRTTIVIAHRLATIRDADRILVIEAGKLIDSGTHEELIAKGGRYAELAELQFNSL